MLEETTLSRRQFLKEIPKNVVKVAAVGAVAGLALKEGEQFVDPWIEVEAGKFYPIYERHDIGLDLHNFPPEIEVLYREGMFAREEGGFSNPTIQSKETLREVLTYQQVALYEQGVGIVWGDCALPPFEGDRWSVIKGLLNHWTIGGLAAFGFDKALRLHNYLRPEKKIKRRAFVSLMSKVGIILASRNLLPYPFVYINAVASQIDTYYRHPAQRVFMRLQALTNHLDFDEYSVFYRNLYIAHKLLLTGYQYRSDPDHKTNIAYEVGALHSGIEDFLMLGIDFCRWLMINLPGKENMTILVNQNSGIESFAKAKMIKKGTQGEVVEQNFVDLELVALLNEQNLTLNDSF